MDQAHIKKKRAILALFFFLLSCSSNQCPKWTYEKVCSSCRLYDSSRLTFSTDNTFRGLELELVQTKSGTYLYLNVSALALPMDPDHPQQTEVMIETDDEEWTVFAERLEGGQRLLFPKESADEMIDFLLNNHTLTISVGRYESVISPEGFTYNFFKLKKSSSR